MYTILGIHFGHDSNASILVDGEIVADVAEERFTREKHSSDYPFNAIAYCLKEAGLSMAQVDEIALGGINQADALNVITGLWPESFSEVNKRPLRTPIYRRQFFLEQLPKITFVEHHMAHAAAAYFTTGEDKKTLIATMDGTGDRCSSALWVGFNNKIFPLVKFGGKGSIGWFYGNVTEALGWWHGDGEGKTMGLAPYGDTSTCVGCLDGTYPHFENGSLVTPKEFKPFTVLRQGSASHWHNKEALAIVEIIKTHGRENVAAEAQRILEREVLDFVLPWMQKENIDVLATAGGVFLNVKVNQRLWESDQVKRHYPYPNAGDSSLALGAALYAAAKADTALNKPLRHLYFGPNYDNNDYEAILKERRISYRPSDDVSREVAGLLSQNKIVGWFQGRMEAGPRALGNRSILMSPLRAENKDVINASVKYREAFRPFCPSMTVEAIDEFLVNAREESFMITSFDCKPNKKEKIPAVVHVDGTMRPQTVRREVNPRYWELINEFGKLTGVPVILNTSMNVRGEPIVCDPRDAIRCFYDSGLDVLALGDFIVEK